jgi:putative phosphoribosyl transferase
MFRNREDAALQLANRFAGASYRDPLVLALSGGGVVSGETLARTLGADLDVVLTRHLRGPGDVDLSIGAITETGDVFLNHRARLFQAGPDWPAHLKNERETKLADLQQLAAVTHHLLPPAHVTGRSVILVDDGVMTGARMIVSLKAVHSAAPFEVIVAVPVIPGPLLDKIAELCDETICLDNPDVVDDLSNYYAKYEAVGDTQMCDILRRFAEHRRKPETSKLAVVATSSPSAGKR